MAIKIKAGMTRAGRITMPKGTYLPDRPKFSNPSTAADGGLGGGGTTPPKAPQIPGVTTIGSAPPFGNPYAAESPLVQNSANLFADIKKWWSQLPGSQRQKTLYNEYGQPVLSPTTTNEFFGQTETMVNKNVTDINGNQYVWDETKRQFMRPATDTFKAPTAAQPNSLVGRDFSSAPDAIDLNTIRQIIPGGQNLSAEQIAAYMQQQGYTYLAQAGGLFYKTQQTSQGGLNNTGLTGVAASGELNARGRPQYVDPTQLAPGERVTAADSTTYVGGTPYTNKGGDTVSQYAITFAGGSEVTKYKEVVKQDNQGNWVKMYIPKTGGRGAGRSRNARSAEKRRSNAAENQAAQEAAVAAQAPVAQPASESVRPPINTQQLVNLRVNYG